MNQRHTWVTWWLFALLLLPTLVKAVYVDRFIYKHSHQWLVGASQVIAHDALILASFLAVFALSFSLFVPRLLRSALWVTLVAALVIYVTDVVVILFFNTHLVLSDILKYSTYTPRYLLELLSGKKMLYTLLTLSTSLWVMYRVITSPKAWTPALRRASWGGAIFLSALSPLASESAYVHAWIYQDLISYNRMVSSESVPYSEAFKATLQTDGLMEERCQEHTPSRPPVILLMVESLSSFQSGYFSGGIKDWTPRLDQLAQAYTSLTALHANGFTTEDGEISLLTGQAPLSQPASFTRGGGRSFEGFFALKDSLPYRLKARDYHTAFLTTADLSFSNTGPWVRSLGFDFVEGHEGESYERWPRFQFKAAPDQALIERIISYVDERERVGQPYFIFSKTVTGHHPFLNPKTLKRSEEGTVRYVDEQLGALYDALKSRGFFEKGVLIITGDHHAMVPLRPEELTRWGAHRAAARIPGVIISQAHQRAAYDQPLQQLDLYQGLINLSGARWCVSRWRGDALRQPPVPPEWILHRRGDMRDKVSVLSQGSPEGDVFIKLDGDRSRVISKGEAQDKRGSYQAVLDYVNRQRFTARQVIK